MKVFIILQILKYLCLHLALAAMLSSKCSGPCAWLGLAFSGPDMRRICNYIILLAECRNSGKSANEIPFHSCRIYFWAQMKLTQHWVQAEQHFICRREQENEWRLASQLDIMGTQLVCRQAATYAMLPMSSDVCIYVCTKNICMYIFCIRWGLCVRCSPHSYPLWQNAIKLLWCFH